jgi:hypothetical protein
MLPDAATAARISRYLPSLKSFLLIAIRRLPCFAEKLRWSVGRML